MNSKLEEKLIQYEKNIPITNKQELLQAVESILKDEESKKANIQDIDLIDEAVDMILMLNEIDIENLEHDANALTDKILNGAHNKVSSFGINKQKKVRIKWLIPVAVILSLLISINLVAYAMGYDLLSMTNETFKQLKEKIWYSNDDKSIIVTNDHREYKDVEEMIEKESFENLLWPTNIDELKSVGDIVVSNYNDELEILCRFNMQGNTIEYSITLSSKYPLADQNLIKIGEYEVAMYEYDNNYQADIVHKDNNYTITAQSQENLVYFIKSLEEINQ